MCLTESITWLTVNVLFSNKQLTSTWFLGISCHMIDLGSAYQNGSFSSYVIIELNHDHRVEASDGKKGICFLCIFFYTSFEALFGELSKWLDMYDEAFQIVESRCFSSLWNLRRWIWSHRQSILTSSRRAKAYILQVRLMDINLVHTRTSRWTRCKLSERVDIWLRKRFVIHGEQLCLHWRMCERSC